MELISILLIAIALAMDAFAVSIASGITLRERCYYHGFRIALLFGTFQALMPVFGYLLGLGFNDLIENVDHWVAFALLVGIGLKMVREGTKGKKMRDLTCTETKPLLFLAVATSIDAFAVGVTFSVLGEGILIPILIIGIITFILSFIGVIIGNRMGHFFERRIEMVGGLALIAIGFSILISHLGIV